jgi:Bardet-Biedl syndrome 1 protein
VAINLNSQIVGIERSTKNIVIGCMDKGLYCYTTKGKKQWRMEMPGDMLTLASMEIKIKGIQAVIVALSNNEVHIYKDKFIISKFVTQDIVVGIKFGKFGREESNLIMTTKSKNIECFVNNCS